MNDKGDVGKGGEWGDGEMKKVKGRKSLNGENGSFDAQLCVGSGSHEMRLKI